MEFEGGGSLMQFDREQRRGLEKFVDDPDNFIGSRGPRTIELAAEDYPALVARAPIGIAPVQGSTYALLPKGWEGDLRGYLAAGEAPLTQTCALPVSRCVFSQSVLVTAASPAGAVIARVASTLATTPDLGTPLAIFRDVLAEKDIVEIDLRNVRVAFAQKTRSLELTAAGLVRTAPQLEHEGKNPPPPNWHAIRSTLPAGAAAVQLVPRLQWLNVGGEYLIWTVAIPRLIDMGAVGVAPVAEDEARKLMSILRLRDAGSRLVAPRLLMGPAESRDRRRHRAIDDAHLRAANYTDAQAERGRSTTGLAQVERKAGRIEVTFESEVDAPGERRRRRLSFYMARSLVKYSGPWVALLIAIAIFLRVFAFGG